MTDPTPYDVTRQSPELEAIPHEADPPDQPPQQDADAPTPDANISSPAFLPEELDPAAPTQQGHTQVD